MSQKVVYKTKKNICIIVKKEPNTYVPGSTSYKFFNKLVYLSGVID